MGELARQERYVIGGDDIKQGADAKIGRPNFDVIQGDNTTPRGERVPLEVVSDEDAETVKAEEEAITAPTEKNFESGDVTEDSAVEIEPVRELEDFAETAPAPTFDIAEATAKAADPIYYDNIDAWVVMSEDVKKEAEEERWGQDVANWFASEGIMPSDDEEMPQVEVEEAVEHIVEGVKALLQRQWGEVGKRVGKLFQHQDARIWAGSTVFGVVSAFAISAMTTAMVGDFGKNLDTITQNSLRAQQIIKNLE